MEIKTEPYLKYGGPLQYLGNRFLSHPDVNGHMRPDNSWLTRMFKLLAANGKKYKRCIEPFAGSASWSLAAMQQDLAEEYIINDADEVLIHTHQLIKDEPERIKMNYNRLVTDYEGSQKKDYFLNTIKTYNHSDLENKALILPFIINYSWGGIIHHDKEGNIIYKEANLDGHSIPRFLQKANLSIEQFNQEVDTVSELYNTNKVKFYAGDFTQVLADVTAADFVSMNPPYPENTRSEVDNTSMYVELYKPESLHEKIITTLQQLYRLGIHYLLTYGLYNPALKQFRIDESSARLYYSLLGSKECAFGTCLDQVYLSPLLSVPKELAMHFIESQELLKGRELAQDLALSEFNSCSATKRQSLVPTVFFKGSASRFEEQVPRDDMKLRSKI